MFHRPSATNVIAAVAASGRLSLLLVVLVHGCLGFPPKAIAADDSTTFNRDIAPCSIATTPRAIGRARPDRFHC